jgi:hypothetical protein
MFRDKFSRVANLGAAGVEKKKPGMDGWPPVSPSPRRQQAPEKSGPQPQTAPKPPSPSPSTPPKSK